LLCPRNARLGKRCSTDKRYELASLHTAPV
jgi:hypothetical protein